MQQMYAIEATELTKRFSAFTAVDAITFTVGQGEIFGFLGANGAGKTTAIKMLIGLSKPSGGTAIVAGLDVSRNTERVKQRIGYMSQKFSLYEDLTVSQNIRFFGGVYGLSRRTIREKREAIIAQLGLERQADQVVADLPLGWKQRLAFAVAGVHDPRIIFMDEPTGGVDPATRRAFWELIYAAAERGTTIFVTTHYMDEAEYCHRVSIMVDGRMDALGTPEVLKKQYGVATMDEVFVQLVRGGKTAANV